MIFRHLEPLRFFLSRNLYSILGGISAGDWLRLLWDNRGVIDPPYWPRAALLTLASSFTAVIRRAEDLGFGWAVGRVEVPPPLFILGHWRSGTTHLHNLLGVDSRFAFPNFYQVMCPHTFLTTEAVAGRLVAWLLPEQRLMDNVREDPRMPHEDEFALCTLTLLSQYLAMVFPRRAAVYDRYLTFRGARTAELARWQKRLRYFLQKLTWKYRRPLLLKSPAHTGRIRLLLGMFPEARFVHIHRNPYRVYQSTRHLHEQAIAAFSLQRPDPRDLQARILRRYQDMYEAFFQERDLIPPGRFHELGFEELENDPVEQLRIAYKRLELPGFEGVAPSLQRYVDSLAGYRKNEHGELPPDLRDQIARAWQRSFHEWGYPV